MLAMASSSASSLFASSDEHNLLTVPESIAFDRFGGTFREYPSNRSLIATSVPLTACSSSSSSSLSSSSSTTTNNLTDTDTINMSNSSVLSHVLGGTNCSTCLQKPVALSPSLSSHSENTATPPGSPLHEFDERKAIPSALLDSPQSTINRRMDFAASNENAFRYMSGPGTSKLRSLSSNGVNMYHSDMMLSKVDYHSSKY
ncbi:hypothetical protein V1511DRAFT_504225 [Dipodascopsis uninucleata]